MRRACLFAMALTIAVAAERARRSPRGIERRSEVRRHRPLRRGATTLDLGSAGNLGERLATVFYPADASKARRTSRCSATSCRPPSPRPCWPSSRPSSIATVTVNAHVDAPGSGRGPFPIVLFSHGFGASRLYYSHILTGIASWGFVVVSADYLERGLLAQATNSKIPTLPPSTCGPCSRRSPPPNRPRRDRSSPLYGVANPQKVAAVGHSAGGQTAFDALKDQRVAMAVGWAPVGPTGAPSHKPAMIIGDPQDIALTPATLTGEFNKFPGPTTFVEISGEGHDTYTDICTSIRDGNGGLVGFADLAPSRQPGAGQARRERVHRQEPPPAAVLADRAVLHRGGAAHGLGIDALDGPGPPTRGQFPGFTITFRQHP